MCRAQPLTHTTCLRVCTTSTRSAWTAAHRPSRAVRARQERFGIALAADDEVASPHRAGNDSQFALARGDRALAGDEDLRADHGVQHELAIGQRILLRPAHRGPVVCEVL